MKTGMDYKLWRVKNGVMAMDVAAYIGISSTYISLIESGKKPFRNDIKSDYDQFIREFEEKKRRAED